MWIFLPGGSFVSVVQKEADVAADRLTIRSRTSTDLVELRKFMPTMGEIERGSGSDYAYRVVAPRAEFAAALARMAEAIRYTNYKDNVSATKGSGRARVLHSIWTLLLKLQRP
ncbi:hypothetical protein [Variovorax sp. RA8]|uniref:hypothetical protein n=1 Tax=Variovorax sp. (strain JCM 16519 / RA8) TaxID=662548 RepID=UPI0013181F53|nr:hypothetical protein [Variovorax sp. RA8]VTU14370.1 hypothetical protein RA8CHR_00557 [Variovorax sp. RA8]